MFIELEDPESTRELSLGVMHDLLPGPLFDFLSQGGSEWDAPLVGGPMATPPVPGPEVFDVRKEPAGRPLKWRTVGEPRTPRGSNNWAVAGDHTADGRAWLIDDAQAR